MGRKEQMKEKAQKHTDTMSKRFSGEIKKCIDETRLYDTDFTGSEEAGKGAECLLEQSYTQDSVVRNSGNGKMAVLNFASCRHAGGGFINGSMAQEERDLHMHGRGLRLLPAIKRRMN